MAVSKENEQLAAAYLEMVNTSDLPVSEKESWIDYIHKAKSSTNGFKPDEKIQLMSELQLRMVGRMLQDRSDSVRSAKKLEDGIADMEKRTLEQITKLDKVICEKIETIKTNQNDMKVLNAETRDLLLKIEDRLQLNDKETYRLVGSEESKADGGKNGKTMWWKELFEFLKDAKWAIAATIGGITLMLAIQPQLADMVERIIEHFSR